MLSLPQVYHSENGTADATLRRTWWQQHLEVHISSDANFASAKYKKIDNVADRIIIFSFSACLIVTYCIRASYNANQPEAWVKNFPQSSHGEAPVSIRASNNEPAQESALSIFSMNVTNEDLDNMEVVSILL